MEQLPNCLKYDIALGLGLQEQGARSQKPRSKRVFSYALIDYAAKVLLFSDLCKGDSEKRDKNRVCHSYDTP
jgi:hypothetical protein